MATADRNDLLTRTGPGTPAGELFRRYWIPALLVTELPEPDCAPVRVTLLSERLLAFRDTQGRVGLIDEFCAHRRVSLWFGRNEESGLRCAYHGWKYDVNGQCVEIPSEPATSGLCHKVKLKSYPCVELGGVVWTYMGTPGQQPPVPEFEWLQVPESHRYVSKRRQESNYLQGMEGGIDSSHISFLHSGAGHPAGRTQMGPRAARYQRDTSPKFEVVESPGGLLIGARRNAEAGHYYWRVTQWIMPWYTMIPPFGDFGLGGHAWVPIDDESCFVWSITHHPLRPLAERELEIIRGGQGIYAELIPGTYLPVANKDNDYLMDRAAQKAGRYYSGVKGISMQDASLQESMGPIVDRLQERLVSTDMAIVQARRRLLAAVEALPDGIRPPGLDPASHRVRAASLVAPSDVAFEEAAREAVKAAKGVPPVSI